MSRNKFSLKKQRHHLDQLARYLGFDPLKEPQRWYSVSRDAFNTDDGYRLLQLYPSHMQAIQALYPNAGLRLGNFVDILVTARIFFDQIALKRGFPPSDHNSWRSLSFKEFLKHKGSLAIAKLYGGFRAALISVYPDLNLAPRSVCKWRNRELLRGFIDGIVQSKGFKVTEDGSHLYNLTQEDFVACTGGGTIINEFGSYREAIIYAYPDIELKDHKFGKIWKGNLVLQRKFFDEIADEEGFDPITQAHKWASVSRANIRSRPGGASLLNIYGGSNIQALLAVYPQMTPTQVLSSTVQKLGHTVICNARKVSGLGKSLDMKHYELDVWIPTLNIGFEYQDKHHYISAWYANDTLALYQAKDRYKESVMSCNGSTLVIVPCWWDETTESLVATIRQKRPELFPHFDLSRDPIPKDPPVYFFTVPTVPDVGELMLASFVPNNSTQLIGWWMGEKFDGLRACWNCYSKKIYSRTGTLIQLAKFYLRALPPTFCDGELWTGRERFKSLQYILGAAESDLPDPFLRFIAFDDPSPINQMWSEFEVRDMGNYTDCIINNAGEGVILRKLNSRYENGRSHSILKYKVSKDGEALVARVQGIYYTCRLATGKVFTAKKTFIGSARIGQVVSYRCLSHSPQGIPKQASIVRLRDDLKWDDVVASELQEKYRKINGML